MYNSKERIAATDTTELSYNQKINRTFTVGEILTSPLWYIKNTEGNVVTAIPLFNCDRIESFNESDIVIDDNKAIIITVDDEDIPIDCPLWSSPGKNTGVGSHSPSRISS